VIIELKMIYYCTSFDLQNIFKEVNMLKKIISKMAKKALKAALRYW